MIKAVIFDMDGLLVDTEPLHSKAYQEVFKKYGVFVSEDAYRRHWIALGKGSKDYVEENNLKLDPETVRNEKKRIFFNLLNTELRAMPGAGSLVNKLSGYFQIALASSTRKENVEEVIKLFPFFKKFKVVVTLADIINPKPNPEIFLKAADRLDVNTNECLVIEDAEKGIIAAHEAGMKSIAVPNRLTMDNDFSKATMVVNSLNDITVDLLKSI